MKSFIFLLASLLSSLPGLAQQRAGYSPPTAQHEEAVRARSVQPEFEEAKASAQKPAAQPNPQLQGAELARVKQDADELAVLAQSVPSDVDQTTKGMLPKDLDSKLKKIEKLAKRLRARISQ